ncbi:hypothetical protein GCM10010353_70910 [Streptomyces chryseus]|uniref:Integral membrane protein n=1 Tax=Streptomyces chryseus TaxID=68186 RepID=A0ABQ3EB27_9ACTN|nr:hypothetical protein GCM10010353_70910 [Streptomyces chryseus]GHB31878.1 hypothetical protein GCM10010346_64060 [Streptomyces chryseus]
MLSNPFDSSPDRPAHRSLRTAARVLAAVGLAVDAYMHAHLADRYDLISATISQGTLFRIEAALAALAALLVLAWRRAPADAFAWLVAAGGLAAVLVYRYLDVGELGPLPNMYEPIWFSDKNIVVIAQALTIAATTVLLLTGRRRRRRFA